MGLRTTLPREIGLVVFVMAAAGVMAVTLWPVYLMEAPLGFLPALLFRNPGWRRSALVGFGISLLVECGQYLVCRTTDIDDIILNTLGALRGYWIFLLLRRAAPNFTRKFQVEARNGRETGDRTPAP